MDLLLGARGDQMWRPVYLLTSGSQAAIRFPQLDLGNKNYDLPRG
jgi:hypothetical protein